MHLAMHRRVAPLWLLAAAAATLGYGAVALSTRSADAPVPTPALAEADALQQVQRSEQRHALPRGLRLQGPGGQSPLLEQALFDGRPVVLSFMFSSCATVCPVTNQTLVAMEEALGPARSRVHTVSLTIDPDHDTVRRLEDYARATGRGGSFFTSDPATSEAVQRAFGVWRGDKMHHPQVVLLSAGPGHPWVRLEGPVRPQQLVDELRRLAPL